MKWLGGLFDIYVNASIHVALAVTAFLLTTPVLLNTNIPSHLVFFVFFSTLACYNYLKFGPVLNEFRPAGSFYKYLAICLSISSALAAVYFSVFLTMESWVLLSVLFVLILLYILPIFPRERNLRSLGFVKVILVSVIWTAVTVLLPIVNAKMIWNWDILVLAFQRFLLVIALIIPFEIRDMPLDPPKIQTLPRKLGVTNTKRLGILLVIISFLLLYLRDEVYEYEIISRGLMMVVISFFILKTPARFNKYYAAFWVEAMPIFWYLSLLGIK